jgi:hypothetical protein
MVVFFANWFSQGPFFSPTGFHKETAILAVAFCNRSPPLMLGVARNAQNPEVGYLIGSTLTLRHDVVNMCPLAMH